MASPAKISRVLAAKIWMYTGDIIFRQSSHEKDIRHLTILIFGWVTTFIVCWTPTEVQNFMRFSKTLSNLEERQCRNFKHACEILVWLSPAVNSMLYLSMGGFRKKMRESITKRLSSTGAERNGRAEMKEINKEITQETLLLHSTNFKGSRSNSIGPNTVSHLSLNRHLPH